MLRGIDTSHFSNFNVTQLQNIAKSNSLYFNFIKATEGATIQDPQFVNIWQMSRDAGLVCGAYHFFRPLADVGLQANNFIAQYKKVSRAGVLPPVIDLEWSKSRTTQLEEWSQLLPTQRIPKIQMFLSALESELHVKPIIYTATGFWKEFITTQSSAIEDTYFSQYPLWVVDLKNSGDIPSSWAGVTTSFVQTHFGEMATSAELYDNSDQNIYKGDMKTLLNSTVPGFTIMKGFPISNIVVELQQQLIQKGFLKDVADGAFGKITEQAVKDFQTSKGLFANGIIDAQTWNVLL